MSLPLTRATTFAEADESDPQEAVTRTIASRAEKTRAFITERSILIRNRGHFSTTIPGRSGWGQSRGEVGGQRGSPSCRVVLGAAPLSPHFSSTFDPIPAADPYVILCV